jgi:hypothetical protein
MEMNALQVVAVFGEKCGAPDLAATFALGEVDVQSWRYSWGTGHLCGVDIFKIHDEKVSEKYSSVKG